MILPEYDGWELRGLHIGEGGQGTVYRARSPARVDQLKQIAEKTGHLLRRLSHPGLEVSVPDLAQKIVELGSADLLEDIGALKVFKIPADDKEEERQAIRRLESEVHALGKVEHPAVLKLLHSNVDKRFIVTEYHPEGTLDKNLQRFQGDALAALQTFRTLVDGVMEIHQQGAVHRDIKPENIFVTASNDLVLGDFGIVFFEQGERLTQTYERVGGHYWMAPWAYDDVRLQLSQIKPPLDIYPLGKVLWSMISGRNGFPYWEYKKKRQQSGEPLPKRPEHGACEWPFSAMRGTRREGLPIVRRDRLAVCRRGAD